MRRIVFGFALCVFLAAPAWAQTVAIRAGNLIDPGTGTVAKNQIILVKDQKIVDVGPSVAIPADAQVVDLSGEWVMPGVMDAHTHITQSVQYFHELDSNYLREDTPLRALRGLWTGQTLLNAGVTTVRDVGNDANFAAVALRKAIEKGWFVGPTIQTAGKIIAPFGGQTGGIPQEIGPFWQFEYYDADNPEEIRKAVRENIYYGADLIKLVADNSDYHYSVDEIRAAVDEAHHANKAVAVHVLGGEAADNVIAGGVDSIEHGFFLTDDQLRRMKEKGMFLSGTDFPTAHFEAGQFKGAKVIGAAIIDRLSRAYKIGVKMGFWHRHRYRCAERNARGHDLGLPCRLARRGSAAGGNPEVHDDERCGTSAHFKPARRHRERAVCGHHRHARKPARQHRVAAQGQLRDEERRNCAASKVAPHSAPWRAESGR